MKLLLIGGGGREHALAWKLAQSPMLDTLWACPGNPGVEREIERFNARDAAGQERNGRCVDMDLGDYQTVASFCRIARIDLIVIGPEQPLVDGLADSLRGAGFAVFGPSAAAARLEGSKGFTKLLCARANIPTARFARASNPAEAEAELDLFDLPVVVKADGLAAGKGVVIAHTAAEADAAVERMFAGGFGGAGDCVVIEEFMAGEEVSFFALTDGETVLPFGSAQDHKRVGEGDTGPNTGGMGAYSPAGIFTPDVEAEVMERIILPTVRTLAADGTPFVGMLYAGLMLTAEGPKLVEYNARFGDPECQVLMARLDSDLLPLLHTCATGRLAEAPAPVFRDEVALTVVMAANGYPGTPEKGGAVALPDGGTMIFQAGTTLSGGELVASGGRVLAVTATGPDIAEAQRRAYEAVAQVDFPTGFFRRDIGWREIARQGG